MPSTQFSLTAIHNYMTIFKSTDLVASIGPMEQGQGTQLRIPIFNSVPHRFFHR